MYPVIFFFLGGMPYLSFVWIDRHRMVSGCLRDIRPRWDGRKTATRRTRAETV